MDRLLGPRQQAVENALARRHLRENTLVLYDVTSCYLEGRHCKLAQRGSRATASAANCRS